MKVVTTTVGTKAPQGEHANQQRLRAAENAAVKAANNLRADALLLPSGFFTARASDIRADIANSLLGIAKRLGIAIVFGVDQEVKDLSTQWEYYIGGNGLPFYGYAWSPSEDVIHCWRQRSTSSHDQWGVPDERCRQPRLVRIGDETLAILMCGEIFNQRIRDALANHATQPKVVGDLAHTARGFRVWQGMKKLAELGLACVCSVHAQCEHAVKHCYVPERGRMSSRTCDDYVFEPARIQLKLWTF